ncbi:NlpC/P60 family protein [Thalassotalea litorea]|uniref:hypothetical protein n=1 Tax=Thalassotalea litorea TaxID=2020715 RepID=UPI003735F6BE
MKSIRFFSFSAFLALSSFNVCANDGDTALPAADKIINAAMPWENQYFRKDQMEQCMNWTREVLVQACGSEFAALETMDPWDKALLGAEDLLLPEHADSLASEEFGRRINRIDALLPGDIVFLKNTYGDWADGVITHVGIATGSGKYIHRGTVKTSLVLNQDIPKDKFVAGLRLDEALCK